MKMVKSLLLGTAAGLVAVAGAQAADLPVKAKPVEYVKVCTAYGEGFFYVPGTDTCIKIGGYVRQDIYFGEATTSFRPDISSGTGRFDRIDTSDSVWQNTTEITTDVRTQTDYGVLRAYTRGGWRLASTQESQGSFYVTRMFGQLGGFTFGRTGSFFDFFNGAFSFAVFQGGGSNSPYGRELIAYTINYGGGLTSSVSIEDPGTRRNAIWDGTNTAENALNVGALPGPILTTGTGYFGDTGQTIGDYAAQSVPDIVTNWKIDQTWGSAQFMTATHQNRAGFYGANNAMTDPTYTGIAPRDEWGYALGAGILLNLPWNKGDKFWVEGTYTHGATAYTGIEQLETGNGAFNRFSGPPGVLGSFTRVDGSVAFGWGFDSVFANLSPTAGTTALGAPVRDGLIESGLHLTTAWSIGAAYEHVWTPAIRTSLYGHITGVTFDSTAKFIICNSPQSPIRNAHGESVGFGAPTLAGCNPNFEVWDIGTRTVWNPVPNLDIGVDVIYAQINNHYDPNLILVSFPGAGGRQKGLYAPADHENSVAAMLRFQRNFYP